MSTTPIKGLGVIAFVLFALFIAGLFLVYKLNGENQALQKANAALEAKFNSSDSILTKIADEQKVIADSNVAVVNMVGTKVAPRSSASVYWDTVAASVYLVVKNMPQLPSDAQYQLWALIDGKPSDLGVFDAKNEKVIVKMKDTKKADAFAITIEKKGGNLSPTLEKMQSMGKTKDL